MKMINYRRIMCLIVLTASTQLSACKAFDASPQNSEWVGHVTDDLPPPVVMKYIETEKSVIPMNYTCFILAEKVAQAYNH